MDPKDIVYINGSFLPRKEARVSVEDRGFVFGDGVYEVLRVINGRLFATRFHNDRLERSLDGVRITLASGDSPASFVEIGKQLLRENDLTRGEATLYIQVTRGATTRAHNFPPPTSHRPSTSPLRGSRPTPSSRKPGRPRSRIQIFAGDAAISRRSTCCRTCSLRRRPRSGERSRRCSFATAS